MCTKKRNISGDPSKKPLCAYLPAVSCLCCAKTQAMLSVHTQYYLMDYRNSQPIL